MTFQGFFDLAPAIFFNATGRSEFPHCGKGTDRLHPRLRQNRWELA